MTAPYLRNAWYQAAWADEIGPLGSLARTLLETPLLLFRNGHGEIAALLDRCPHRFAPLSKGRVSEGIVTCGYHGLAFDARGQCVHNPHGPIPPRAQVPSFAVLERHDAVWVWMGAPAEADPAALPDFSFIDQTPETAKFHGLMPTAANYQLITDNLLDLSHVAFLHAATFGNILRDAKMNVAEHGSGVAVRWNATGCEPPDTSPYRAFVPTGLADIWAGVDWAPPATLVINSGAVPAGAVPTDTDQIFALHSLAPETPTTTHYFYCVTRKFMTDSREVTAVMQRAAELAFTSEDKPMVEAQQSRIVGDDLFAMKPLLLSVDSAAVRARRKLERLITNESHLPVQAAPLPAAL